MVIFLDGPCAGKGLAQVVTIFSSAKEMVTLMGDLLHFYIAVRVFSVEEQIFLWNDLE